MKKRKIIKNLCNIQLPQRRVKTTEAPIFSMIQVFQAQELIMQIHYLQNQLQIRHHVNGYLALKLIAFKTKMQKIRTKIEINKNKFKIYKSKNVKIESNNSTNIEDSYSKAIKNHRPLSQKRSDFFNLK